ncbi:MAG: TonB-dependent receptor [Flavobacteriales bacterium]
MIRVSILSLFLFIQLSIQAQHSLMGSISDESGEGIAGATIVDQGTFLGAVSDAQGSFTLKGIKPGKHVIKIEFLGMIDLLDTLEIQSDFEKNFRMKANPYIIDELVVEATRAGKSTPMTREEISKEQIEANNLGQDLPILLNQSVSMVTTSDAGAGVGYTGMRIRGSDATRINVTVNGVPINDAESHGVFWVNMPDFASTTNSIQIQRGVGTSSNGAAAFGASVNLETTGFDSVSFVELNNSYGSFNTHKHNVIYNSGLISDHFNFEGRMSYIGSDGYIDRSAADLRSYYAAGGYYGKKLLIKGVTFAGHEVTHQAWWGTPESRIQGDDQAMIDHAINNGYSEDQTNNLLTSGRTYNYYTYDNEIDDYAQTHYQVITGYELAPSLYLNVTGHYTRGIGYFEQSKLGDDLAGYGLNYPIIGSDTITNSDLVLRRWLDNHFYGGVYSLKYSKRALHLTFGGSYNRYVGDHYGEIIWSEYAVGTSIRERYYFNSAKKSDLSNYAKAEYFVGKLTFYADIQYRYLEYSAKGVDNDQRPIAINRHFNFLNPKAGVNYRMNSANNFYFSIAQSSREPVRSDFTDANAGVVPKPEFLTNGELGWQFTRKNLRLGANAYVMYYQDQLVLTGEVNDVGSPIRTNVSESYRTGLEFSAAMTSEFGLFWRPNLTLSQNKITKFNETLYDYTTGFDIVIKSHAKSDIAFSPSIIAGSQLGYQTKFGLSAALLSKYVGKQYLDNTSDNKRAIAPYLVNDIRLSYQINGKYWKNLELSLLINNILDELYESNGYTYSYIYGTTITENFYYPQAGRNWLAGVKWRF